MQRIIKIVKTKEENNTLSINNVFLHSVYSPTKEAGKFIENNILKLKNKEYIVVYGIGLGYHLRELIKLIGENTKIFAFDVDYEVIKKSEELGMLDDLRNNKNIELFLGYDLEEFFKKLSEKMNLVEDIIIYKPSVKTLPAEFDDLKNILNAYELSKIAVEKFGQMAKENYIANLEEKPNTIKDFFNNTNFKEKPIVIVSGGPSLENELIELKKYRNYIFIFALGRTLDILIKNGIKPDVICIIDPQNIVFEQISDYLSLEIPLCFLSTACSNAVRKYTGPKYIFFNELDENNTDKIIINTGKSVAVAALDLAVKCGAKQIVFVGQDLAFVDNKFHAGDKVEDQTNSIPKGRKQILGVNGSMLNTNLGLLEFKRNIEKIVNDTPYVKFINCSKGARIIGTIEMEFKDLFS